MSEVLDGLFDDLPEDFNDIVPDKEQAESDAELLTNNADCADDLPYLETRRHIGDEEDDPNDVHVMMGDETFCVVHPRDQQTDVATASAIARSGVHIRALLAENKRLSASLDRDLFDRTQALYIMLRKLYRAHDRLLAHTHSSIGVAYKTPEVLKEAAKLLDTGGPEG